jgi:hypothetical protein
MGLAAFLADDKPSICELINPLGFDNRIAHLPRAIAIRSIFDWNSLDSSSWISGCGVAGAIG